MKPLRILYVAYPLLSLTQESCGGAEQVLLTLESEMAGRGHSTVLAAAVGSRPTGELYPTGAPADGPDQFAVRDAEQNRRILQLLAADDGFDLVHDMSGAFFKHAGEVDLPVLATLHLPPVLYGPDMFRAMPPNLFFNCVSWAQAKSFPKLPRMLGIVPNGVGLQALQASPGAGAIPGELPSRDYLLWMGRICHEKGPHVALDVARNAALPLVMAGSVYPFSYHHDYFEREISPRLRRDASSRFVESVTLDQKRLLLQHARALLVTSLIDETSSLVAMEAAAVGTPVIAFRRGGIPEVVADGVTGFLVDSFDDMRAALASTNDIDRDICRRHARRWFSGARMAADYERIYDNVLQFAPRARSGLQAA